MDKLEKMHDRIVTQAFALIELAASEARKDAEKRAAGVRTIASQLRVLAELGVGEVGAETEGAA